MKKYIIWSILSVLTFAMVSCSDEDDPFAGNDNFITSFTLKQGEDIFTASFKGDTILLRSPEGISLRNAKAEVVCSENSSINPNPATIENWDEQIYFVVTSLNGAKRKYIYIPEKGDLSISGVIMLNTQEEVNTFGAEGLTRIDGSLIIGRQEGSDTIRSLAALSSLRHVSNNVIINKRFLGSEFSGLDNLETIGGTLHLNSADSLYSLALNQLLSVGGDLNITSASISTIDCPKLKSVGGTMTLATSFVTSNFPTLQQVGGDILLKGSSAVKKFVFQSLKKVSGTLEMNMSSVSGLEFPELQVCNKLTISKSTLGLLYCPKLQYVSADMSIGDNPLYEVSFPELVHAGSITLSCAKVNQLNMPILKDVDGNFSITLAGLDPQKLSSLETIGGTLSLIFTADRLQMPSRLKKIGTLILAAGIGELDIRGVEIAEIRFNGAGLENTTVIGDETFKGGINLSSLTGAFPKLEGFHKIEWLTIGYLSGNNLDIEINNIRKIKGDFSYWSNSNVASILLSDLEEVGGNFKLRSNIKKYSFPGLKSIQGDASMGFIFYENNTFPLLTKVGRGMRIQTGYSTSNPEKILYPALKEIGGTLELAPYVDSPTYTNQKWTDLDFLAGIETIGGFKITNHTKLTSYEGLKKAIATCPEDKWEVTGNLYNPTYRQLVDDRQWVKP
jgi:hypothetical protein